MKRMVKRKHRNFQVADGKIHVGGFAWVISEGDPKRIKVSTIDAKRNVTWPVGNNLASTYLKYVYASRDGAIHGRALAIAMSAELGLSRLLENVRESIEYERRWLRTFGNRNYNKKAPTP